jgi:hypothetical protein
LKHTATKSGLRISAKIGEIPTFVSRGLSFKIGKYLGFRRCRYET